MKTVVIILVLLGISLLADSQLCIRAPTAGFCRAPSASVMQELQIAVNYAYNNVMDSVVVNSQYAGRPSCGGVSCRISQSAAKARAKALAPAAAFAAVARDLAEWYIKTVGAGCPNARLLENYKLVLLRWADKDGFLGKVSPQGVLEVDWKIVTISAGYLKMKRYFDAPTRNKVEAWIAKLYAVSAGRDADALNNHFIWHNSAQLWSALALGRGSVAASHLKVITDHMDKYITAEGVIKTEGRCSKTLHYHYFYLEASLGAIAAWKYYSGSNPAAWTGLASRVKAIMDNINNPKLGIARTSKEFDYANSEIKACRPGRIEPVDSGFLTRINGLYQTVIAPRGTLAACSADSSYYGSFRYMPYMWKGAVNPPVGKVCCA